MSTSKPVVGRMSTGKAEALRDWIARDECLVVRDDGKIVGFGIAKCSFFAQSVIVLLVVHPAYRRSGVASAIIHAVEARSPTPKLLPMVALRADF